MKKKYLRLLMIQYINLILTIIICIIVILNSIKLYSKFDNTNLEQFSSSSSEEEYPAGPNIPIWLPNKILYSTESGDIIRDYSDKLKTYIDKEYTKIFGSINDEFEIFETKYRVKLADMHLAIEDLKQKEYNLLCAKNLLGRCDGLYQHTQEGANVNV